MIHRHASAVWSGGLKEGSGTVSSESGVLSNADYSFAKRFETTPGTNPEELIAAAHASCFSMALSAQLGQVGIIPQHIETKATISLDKGPEGFVITQSHLDVQAWILGIDPEQFNRLANQAKETCPVSRLLNAKLTMTALLAV